MEKNEIEQKDLQIIKQLREIYKKKEIPTPPKKVFWKKLGVWLPVLCCGVIVLGLFVFKQPSTTAFQDTAFQEQEVVVKHIPTPVRSDEPMMLVDTKKVTTATGMDGSADSASSDETVEAETAESETVEAETAESETAEAETVEAETAESETAEAEVVNTEAAPTSSGGEFTGSEKAIADSSDLATDPPVEPIPTEKGSLSADVQITQLVTCGGVQDKQYASEKSTFSLAADPIAMVWMRVLSKTPPFTLKHVYFLNGKQYCDVALNIRYPHMRTWSRVTINSDDQIGKWHVDVVNENEEKLDQIEFTVGP